MDTIVELGQALAARRKARGLRQGAVAAAAGVSVDALSRLERGAATEYGVRKLMQVLAVLDAELEIVDRREGGLLDDLRRERGGT